MKENFKRFGINYNQDIPVDEFVDRALYHKNFGYYSNNIPFGKSGDFITAPTISNIFSEIIAVWIVTSWENFGKPKEFNLVELGPGDGSLSKVLVKTFKKFPEFNKAIKLYLYEKSKLLIKIQKKKLKKSKVEWIANFKKIKKGPVIFFGNEFFDALPIKQYIRKKGILMEKCFMFNNRGMHETFKSPLKDDLYKINSFKIFRNSNFIEYPKQGLFELDKIVKKISALNGGILLIDYGQQSLINRNSLQAVIKNKKLKIDKLFENLGKADITSLVNFGLLKEYFLGKKLKVKKIVSQKYFLERMGIMERADMLEKSMTLKQKNYISVTLNRLLNKKLMGELFKVIFAFKNNSNKFLGFN